MKTKVIIIALAIAGSGFTACNDDDNIDIGKEKKEVEIAFSQKYPEAAKVSWEKERDYFVADFWRPDLEAEACAWFDADAVWYFTETDIYYDALPQAVKTTFETSGFFGWRIDDVDMIERPGTETVYVLEIEKGNKEYDLFFQTDGTLLKTVPDTDNNRTYI